MERQPSATRLAARRARLNPGRVDSVGFSGTPPFEPAQAFRVMLPRLTNLLRRSFPNLLLPPQGEHGVRTAGHREYVGGLWEEIGQLQFEMLLAKGLRPEHHLLDIACGALRLGVKAIPYLEAGHYHGVEKERSLVEAGIERELGTALFAERMPELIVSADFAFERLSADPDYAIAQSLFTHLTRDGIALCFRKLRSRMRPGSVFYATFFEASTRVNNPRQSHDRGYFAYTRSEMLEFGVRNGFAGVYLGDWGHPRGQVLVEYRPDHA